MSALKPFNCPTCSAALNVDEGHTDPVIQCPYCSSSVVVPEDIRAKPQAQQQSVVINIGTEQMPGQSVYQGQIQSQPQKAKGGGCGIILAAFIMFVVAAAGIVFALFDSQSLPPALDTLVQGLVQGELPSSGDLSSVGDLVSGYTTFGSEGIGPGQFEDIRHVGVDGEGNIYVGEYQNGRIQVFDSEWNPVSLITIDNDLPLTGFAVSRDGTVYIAQGGVISKHTESFIEALQYPSGFRSVNITPAGGLITSWTTAAEDNIVRFDAAGNVTLTITNAISSVGDTELNHVPVVDGLGNIYSLGTFNNAIFVFDSEGNFVNRFGSEGDEEGQFTAPLAITVDGWGQVYVSDIWGIQVFGSDGRYIRTIKLPNPALGMTFDFDNDQLLIAARTHVILIPVEAP